MRFLTSVQKIAVQLLLWLQCMPACWASALDADASLSTFLGQLVGFVLADKLSVDTNNFLLGICCWANINGAISGNAVTQLCLGKERHGNNTVWVRGVSACMLLKKCATRISSCVIELI